MKTTTVGGIAKISAEKDMLINVFDGSAEFNAGLKNQWTAPKTFIGNYEEMVVGDENKNFIACIEFYRSLENSNNKFGKEDILYNGEFGFDRYNKKINADGLSSRYEKLRTVIPKDKTYANRKEYICSYLSIWPPNIDGNTDNKKSTVSLFVKANEASTKGTSKEAEIELTSSDEKIKITPSTIKLTLDGDAQKIVVECSSTFEKDVTIIAKAKNEPQELGKLIVKANTIYKTIIQPVKVTFGSVASTQALDIPHVKLMTDIVKLFNENSFNQAYMYGKLAPNTKHVTFLESEFKEYFNNIDGKKYLEYSDPGKRKALEYNELMGRRYEANNSGKADQQRREELLNKKIENLLKEFDKIYSYKNGGIKKAKEMHKNHEVTSIWNNPKIKTLYNDFVKEKNEYDNKYPEPFELDQNGKIYFFYTEDIHGAGTPEREVQAFSMTEEGTAQIFNSALTDKDSASLVIHELGHAFGLRHPFSEDAMGKFPMKEDNIKYKQDYDKEIKKIEGEINETIKPNIKKQEELEAMSKKESTPLNESQGLTLIDKRYKLLENMVKQQYTYEDFQRRFIGLLESGTGIINLENKELSQIDTNPSSLSQEKEKLKNKEEELARLKEERKKAQSYEELPNYRGNSETLENYLDYRQKPDGTFNSNFQYKSFYQWQWSDMLELGKNKKFLIQIQ